MKKIWNEFRKRTTRKKVLLSIFFSLAILLFSYVLCNTSIPLPDEMAVLQGWDKFKAFNSLSKDSIPDEVLLVNVSFDKQLVDYEKKGMPVGQYAITDRRKLLQFLRLAQKANNYKYILLDIIFEKGIASETDSALFQQITSMDHIVIPVHKDAPLQDSILYEKAAIADYTVTWLETSFSRFKFRWGDLATIPLRMYQELNCGDISRHGIFYTSCNWLCQNAITLQLPIKMSDDTENEGNYMKYNVVQLGVDLLELDSISPVANDIKDKIVVIGDFYTDTDKHDTYLGPQPGSIICLNAYYALMRGDHVLDGWKFFFYSLISLIYFILTLCYLNGFSLSELTEKLWLKAIISFGSMSFLFWTVAIFGYLFFDTVYNFWLPIGVFATLRTILYIKYIIKEIRNEKAKSTSGTTMPGTIDSISGELQDSLPKQQQDKNQQ